MSGGYGFASQSPRFEHRERNSKADALSDHEFEKLYEAAQRLENKYYSLQCMFVIMVAGRLGLRRGEIAHMKRDWVDLDEKMVRVPRYEPCQKGRDGGACGYCHRRAEEKAEYNEHISKELALDKRWHPKTEESIREVPFSFSARAEVLMERYWSVHSEFPDSCQAINRRVERAAEKCESVDADNFYPHALRATAASYHAGRGLSVTPLQSMFGWADLKTPMKYVKKSGKNTARELENIHNR